MRLGYFTICDHLEQTQRRVTVMFLRPTDDEFLRIVIEIALVEGRRVHRIEELVQGLHLHFDQSVVAGSIGHER